MPPGKHLSPEEFRQVMTQTPSWNPEETLDDSVVTNEGGRYVYRISVRGDLEDVKVVQNFYLVAGPNGDQAVVVFTMNPGKVEKLGTRDLSVIGSIDFPRPKP